MHQKHTTLPATFITFRLQKSIFAPSHLVKYSFSYTFVVMKQVVFTAMSIFLILQIFVGSVGIALDHHHCSKDGDSYHLYLSHDEVCGNHVVTERNESAKKETCGAATSSCCAVNSEKSSRLLVIDEPACCSVETVYLSLDSEYTHVNVDEISIDAPLFIVQQQANKRLDQLTFQIPTYRGPPPVSVGKHLSLLQSYLI